MVAEAPQASALMQEESFGPVLGVAPAKDDAHALELMADTPYGLTAGEHPADCIDVARIGPNSR